MASARKARAWWSSPIPGWRSTRRNACSARNSGWSWLPISDIQQAASRIRLRLGRVVREQRIGPGEQRRRQGRVAAELRGQVAAGGQQRVLARGPLGHAAHEPALAQAAGAEHHAPRARWRAARGAARRRRRAGRRCAGAASPAAAPAPARPALPITPAQIARLLPADRVMMHHVQRVAGLRHVDARQRAPRAADQIQIAARRPRDSQATVDSSASAMARARIGSPPDCSASRITPRPQWSARRRARRPSRRTSSSEPPPISASTPSALGMPHSTPVAE